MGMVSTHMVTTTLDFHPTLGQLFQATQDQLSQLSPESLHQLSQAILLQLLPEPLEYGREKLRLRLSQRLMPFMESTHMDTTTLDFQPTPDQLSLPMQDQSFLATPDQLFLDTPASTESVVCGKMYSHNSKQKLNSNSIQNLLFLFE